MAVQTGIVVEEELWIVQTPEGLTLSRPWITVGGVGARGLVPWPVTVLHRGMVVEVAVVST